jgi:hypothetical protein
MKRCSAVIGVNRTGSFLLPDVTYFSIDPSIDSKNTVKNLTHRHHGIDDGYLGDVEVVNHIHALSIEMT